MKNILAVIGFLLLVFLAGYFGFLHFLGIKGKKCISGGGVSLPGNYKYGKCNIKMPESQVNCVDGCDQNNYGRDCNGFIDPINCGAGRVAQ